MVTIHIQTASHYPINRKQLTDALQKRVMEELTGDVEVSVVIVGDRRMRDLNNTYRGKDYPTDVLSFPQEDTSQRTKGQFISAPDEYMILGDIVISYPQAVIEAGEENTLVDDMIVFLALHGLEHLLGHHHPEE